jgi:hypothetical protein
MMVVMAVIAVRKIDYLISRLLKEKLKKKEIC